MFIGNYIKKDRLTPKDIGFNENNDISVNHCLRMNCRKLRMRAIDLLKKGIVGKIKIYHGELYLQKNGDDRRFKISVDDDFDALE